MKRLVFAGVGSAAVAIAALAIWGASSEPFGAALLPASAGTRVAAASPGLPAYGHAATPASERPAGAGFAASSRPAGPTLNSVAAVEANFRLAQDLRAFADELLARESRLNREERYFLAKALETCGFALSMNDDLVQASQVRRREFVSTLSPSDPEFERRLASYDAGDDLQRCKRFQGQAIAQSKIDALYRLAGDGGDPRAQARVLVAELSKNLAIPKNNIESTRVVEQDDFQRIVSLLETRNADAIVTVAQLLAEHRLIEQLRIGPTGEAPNPASLVGALTLVACDFQPSCSSFDREALQACAHAGYCSAGSYEELYANFLASPYAWSLASRYRSLIHTAIETRDWSLLGLQKLVGARAKARF